MLIGKLDQPITFERQTNTVDDVGAPLKRWVKAATAWANFLPVMGRERSAAPKPMPVYAGTFRIRYQEVDPSWRIIYDGKPWRITGIAEFGRKAALDISAERIDS